MAQEAELPPSLTQRYAWPTGI